MFISIAVFAHNEADHIAQCLASVLENGYDGPLEVHVLVNGCTDNTLEIARSCAAQDTRLRIHALDYGDKARSWTLYMQAFAPGGADLHICLDGDVSMAPGALGAMAEAARAHPEALAFSALPRGGRTATAWAVRMVQNHGLAGNFYGLRESTRRKMHENGFFLPAGMMGDDAIQLWYLRHGLDPNGPLNRAHIQPVPDAVFVYRSFPRNTFSGLRNLIARQLRYSWRDVQVRMAIRHLKRGGAMPRYIDEITRDAPIWAQLVAPTGLRPFKLRKLLFLYSWIKVRRPVKRGAYGDSVKSSEPDATNAPIQDRIGAAPLS